MEQLIENMRQSGVRLDRNGRFWHKDGEVTHRRTLQTLLRWLDRLPDGRPILRLDDNRYVYLDVEESLLLVTSLRWDQGRATLRLNDGSEEELRYDTLRQSPQHVMYCLVRPRRLSARITTAAYFPLAAEIVELDAPESGFALGVGERRFPILATSDGSPLPTTW